MTALLFLLLAFSWTEAAPSTSLATSFPLPNAAYLAVIERPTPNSTEPSLLITSFTPFGVDGVYSVPNLKTLVTTSQPAQPSLVSSSILWPNRVVDVPKLALKGFRHRSAIVGSGFIFPAKSTGAITILDLETTINNSFVLSTPKAGYFYHQPTFFDVDGDCNLDVISARTNGGPGELVWFEQPRRNPLAPTNLPWKEAVLATGPDVFFTIGDIDDDGKAEIIAAQYFTQQLTLYWCPFSHWSKCNTTTTKSLIIDNTIGALFDVELADINNDGKLDLLVTNNANNGTGAVFVYEIPRNPKKSQPNSWTRHTLLSGQTPPVQGIPGSGAPGNVLPFHKHVKRTNEKPLIVLSGDDDGLVTLLTPNSTHKNDWTYNAEIIYQAEGTAGEVTVADVDGDGINEILFATYEESEVRIYRFN